MAYVGIAASKVISCLLNGLNSIVKLLSARVFTWRHMHAFRDVVTSHDAVTMARNDFKRRRSAQEIADRLTKTAIQRRTEDNVSVVVIDLGGGKDGWEKPQQKNSDKWKSFLGLKK